MKANDILNVYIGGNCEALTGTSYTVQKGGYNGGGDCIILHSPTISGGSGGGATHIATVEGLLSTLESNKNNILIVSGGGGGSAFYTGSNAGSGGSGGGITGNNGGYTSNYSYGTGASQLSGGYYSNDSSYGTGSFGLGASTCKHETYGAYYGGAGGGGFYGGGSDGGFNASGSNGGGGGSGFIGSSLLIQNTDSNVVNKMYCYECQESNDLKTYTTSTHGATTHNDQDLANCPSGYSADPVSKCAKAGNGYARISIVSSN